MNRRSIPRRSLVGLAASLALASCAHGEQTPTSFGEGPFAAHQAAIASFQRLSGAVRPLGSEPPCLELCQQQTLACAASDEVCEADDPRCKESRSGCAWTQSLLPIACRFCTTEG